jgi:hypothetical protein
MKKIYTLVLVMIMAASASAQDFTWVTQAGLWAYDYGYGIGTDAAGNVYVSGKYEEQAIFDANTQVSCAGNHDIWVAKYSPNGQLQWVRTAGGPDGDYARCLAVDPAGNTYVAGEIEGTAMFGSVQVQGHNGTNDIFVAKYDTNGNLVWAKYYGGWSDDKARSIAIDASGNCYITGEIKGAATFGSTTLNTNGGSEDIFVAKLDPSGNALWAKRAGGSMDEGGKGIKVDVNGNVFVAGFFGATADFSSSTSLTAPNGFFDMFLAKYDSNGNLQWVNNAGDDWDDVAWAIALDNSGNAYVTGEFNAAPMFGSQQLITNGMADVFIAKYNSSGAIQWAQRFGGDLIDRARGIATDGTNVYVTGQYGGTASVGSHTVTSVDSSDIFVASFTASSGSGNWVIVNHGPADAYEDLGYESGTAVHVDNTGYVYVTGAFLDEDLFNYFNMTGWTRTDAFVGKIDPGVPTGTVGMNELASGNDVNVLPNPSNGVVTVNFNASKEETYTVQVTNTLGQAVFSEKLSNFSGQYTRKIDLTGFGSGMYLLNISGAGAAQVQKVVIQ